MDNTAFIIVLTPKEADIVQTMQFDPLAFKNDHAGFLANSELAHKLTSLLIERGGIPEQRLRYFTDPDYYEGGRGKSRQQVFERNGTAGDGILRHPHFLKYLRYFIYGAVLPQAIIHDFVSAVADCGMVTSGDLISLGSKARKHARMHRLEPKMAAEEFYRLCLDLEMSTGYASSIRRAVLQLRNQR
jgi:hypothetical protein